MGLGNTPAANLVPSRFRWALVGSPSHLHDVSRHFSAAAEHAEHRQVVFTETTCQCLAKVVFLLLPASSNISIPCVHGIKGICFAVRKWMEFRAETAPGGPR